MKGTTKGAIVGNAMVLAKVFGSDDQTTQVVGMSMACGMWFPVLWDAAFGDGAPFARRGSSDGTEVSGQSGRSDVSGD